MSEKTPKEEAEEADREIAEELKADYWRGVTDLAALVASGSVHMTLREGHSAKIIARNSVDIALALLDEVAERMKTSAEGSER